MAKITAAQLDDLIEGLRGTCGDSIDSEMESRFGLSEDDLTPAQLSDIYEQIFICDGCGWWCEHPAEDTDAGQFCGDCIGEQE